MKKNIKTIVVVITLLLSIYYAYQYEIDSFVNKQFRKTEPVILTDKENFKIYFLDVGEADAILISNNGENTLVDAGNNRDGNNLVNYFRSLGITSFKYVIGTHIHEDHIGGMDNIIRSFNIEHFYMPDVRNKTKTFTEILDCLATKNILFETPDIDSTFMMADTKFQILSISNEEEDLNDTSIVLKVTYKNTSYLLMADASKTIERRILNKDIRSDVLKVGHHGSRYSTYAQFLRKVNPKYAVITVGLGNDYNHPHQVTLDKLERLNVKVYRTDTDNTIIASSDGENIYFESIETDLDGNKKD